MTRPLVSNWLQIHLPFPVRRNDRVGAFLNFLLIALIALGGEWIVHQVEYLIVYGSRFPLVMQSGAHGPYMAPFGWALLVATAGVVLTGASAVCRYASQGDSLKRMLPLHVRDAWSRLSNRAQPRILPFTIALLASLQVAIYFAQENLEASLSGQRLPGASVLVSPLHLTVIPLDALVATLIAVVLCGLVGHLHRLRFQVRLGRALHRLLVCARKGGFRPLTPVREAPPGRRLDLQAVGLRSPPLVA